MVAGGCQGAGGGGEPCFGTALEEAQCLETLSETVISCAFFSEPKRPCLPPAPTLGHGSRAFSPTARLP